MRLYVFPDGMSRLTWFRIQAKAKNRLKIKGLSLRLAVDWFEKNLWRGHTRSRRAVSAVGSSIRTTRLYPAAIAGAARNLHRFLVVYKVTSDFFLGSLGPIGEPKYFGLAIFVDSFGAVVAPAGSRLSS
jgi:hypothetical protein